MNRQNGEPDDMTKKMREAVKADAEQLSVGDEPTYEQICARAYEIHIERGGEHGRDTEDWLQAERELKQRAG